MSLATGKRIERTLRAIAPCETSKETKTFRNNWHLSVRESWGILDGPGCVVDLIRLGIEVELHQLRERLHRVVRAENSARRDGDNSGCRYLRRISTENETR
mgnify:CR=1 FL=1|jgi:hypothetical protein